MVEPGISVQYGSGSASFPWGTILTGLVTAAAALTGSWLSNSHQTKLQRDRLVAEDQIRQRDGLRAHGEEIVSLTRDWIEVFGKALRSLEGELSKNRVRPETITNIQAGQKTGRITMLTKIDFPEAVEQLEALLKSRRDANGILQAGVNAHGSADRLAEAGRIDAHLDALNATQLTFTKAITKSIQDRCRAIQ